MEIQKQRNNGISPQHLANATDVKCGACGSELFKPVFLIKHLSALVSPVGEEAHIPIQTFACDKCGHVNSEFLPKLG